MSVIPYVQPEFRGEAFNCPHCHAYSKQTWKTYTYWGEHTGQALTIPGQYTNFWVSVCDHCAEMVLWNYESEGIIYPDVSGAPPVNADVNDLVAKAYGEAASIANKSPRGAAALLRLAIQHLCIQLGQPGKNIDKDIAALVKDGLPVKIQQALDVVRVTGNESVHPGTIDVSDKPEVVSLLFQLVNTIAEQMITHPREIEEAFGNLPEAKLEGIKQRDA